MAPLDIPEEDIGNYLFDYFETVPQIFKNHFITSAASLKQGMYEHIRQHYHKIINMETKRMEGLVIYGQIGRAHV